MVSNSDYLLKGSPGRCIPSSGRVQKTLAVRAEPLSFGPKVPEDRIESGDHE